MDINAAELIETLLNSVQTIKSDYQIFLENFLATSFYISKDKEGCTLLTKEPPLQVGEYYFPYPGSIYTIISESLLSEECQKKDQFVQLITI